MHNVKVVLDDFNAKMEKEKTFRMIVGKKSSTLYSVVVHLRSTYFSLALMFYEHFMTNFVSSNTCWFLAYYVYLK